VRWRRRRVRQVREMEHGDTRVPRRNYPKCGVCYTTSEPLHPEYKMCHECFMSAKRREEAIP